jgi:hypothetical protein
MVFSGAAYHTCSLSMTILADEAFLSDPYPLSSQVCSISQRYVYLDSADPDRVSTDVNFSYGRIVRGHFTGSDLFALALTLYSPSTFSVFIDRRNTTFSDSWLDASLALLARGSSQVVTDSSKALTTSSSLLRHILLYTDIHYSSIPAISLISSTTACHRLGRISDISGRLFQPSVNCSSSVPSPMICPSRHDSSTDVAVVIPAFKRDYMSLLAANLSRQTHPPRRFFILQNSMHLILNFTRILNSTTLPIVHVWCTNWNSFFYLTYFLGMFVPERFVLKIDDDHIPSEKGGLARFCRKASPGGAIVGRGRQTLNRELCGIRPAFAADERPGYGQPWRTDHVAGVVLFEAAAAKIVNRFRPFSLLGAEDAAISLANAVECGTEAWLVEFAVMTFQKDGNSHRNDGEIREGYAKLRGNLLDSVYCHFIGAGYRPVRWVNFSVSEKTDIRWPH